MFHCQYYCSSVLPCTLDMPEKSCGIFMFFMSFLLGITRALQHFLKSGQACWCHMVPETTSVALVSFSIISLTPGMLNNNAFTELLEIFLSWSCPFTVGLVILRILVLCKACFIFHSCVVSGYDRCVVLVFICSCIKTLGVRVCSVICKLVPEVQQYLITFGGVDCL